VIGDQIDAALERKIPVIHMLGNFAKIDKRVTRNRFRSGSVAAQALLSEEREEKIEGFIEDAQGQNFFIYPEHSAYTQMFNAESIVDGSFKIEAP
jgi:hypothetical protein